MSIRLGLALIVFALDLWALTQLFGEDRTRRDRWRWTFAILALPIIGILLWRRNNKRRIPGSRLQQRLQ